MQPLTSAVSHGKELYNTNSPNTSLVTIVFANMCMCRVLLRLLVQSKKYGIITMAFTAVAVYQEPLRGEGQELFASCLTK